MPKVNVYVLRDGLRFEGMPYLAGNQIKLPEYMLKEWLALGLVSLESPAPAKVMLEAPMRKNKSSTKTAAGHPVEPGTAAGKSTAGSGTAAEKKP